LECGAAAEKDDALEGRDQDGAVAGRRRGRTGYRRALLDLGTVVACAERDGYFRLQVGGFDLRGKRS
jgi:hypothetical protein